MNIGNEAKPEHYSMTFQELVRLFDNYAEKGSLLDLLCVKGEEFIQESEKAVAEAECDSRRTELLDLAVDAANDEIAIVVSNLIRELFEAKGRKKLSAEAFERFNVAIENCESDPTSIEMLEGLIGRVSNMERELGIR